METYSNEKGEVVVIKDMDSIRLIHAIAKYSNMYGSGSELAKALKSEAISRLSIKENKDETQGQN